MNKQSEKVAKETTEEVVNKVNDESVLKETILEDALKHKKEAARQKSQQKIKNELEKQLDKLRAKVEEQAKQLAEKEQETPDIPDVVQEDKEIKTISFVPNVEEQHKINKGIFKADPNSQKRTTFNYGGVIRTQ